MPDYLLSYDVMLELAIRVSGRCLAWSAAAADPGTRRHWLDRALAVTRDVFEVRADDLAAVTAKRRELRELFASLPAEPASPAVDESISACQTELDPVRLRLRHPGPGSPGGRNPQPAGKQDQPWFVSVGGQPGSGKGRAVDQAMRSLPGSVVVNGDELRPYHPAYERLMTSDPLRMPEVTAQASGQWVEMASQWLRERRVSAVIETTLHRPAFLVEELARYRAAGFATQLRVVAVPPEVSRLGTLARYLGQAQDYGAGRSVTLSAHDDRAAAIPGSVAQIVAAGVVDRLVVQDGDGQVALDTPAAADGPDLAAQARGAVERLREISSLTREQAQEWFAAVRSTLTGLATVRVDEDLLAVAARLAGPDAAAVAARAWTGPERQDHLAGLRRALEALSSR
ncbi:MAG: zeta toxin family protein [Actinomycetia bacterium]|nr:zeta toxin family protein [Actinomycetes bacterium]